LAYGTAFAGGGGVAFFMPNPAGRFLTGFNTTFFILPSNPTLLPEYVLRIRPVRKLVGFGIMKDRNNTPFQQV